MLIDSSHISRLNFVYFTYFFYGVCSILPSNIYFLIVEVCSILALISTQYTHICSLLNGSLRLEFINSLLIYRLV